jgi:MFS superfamily sulfate permease-like transporter
MVRLFGAAILEVFLLFFTWLLRTLPNVARGAIIMVAASNLINLTEVRRQYALQRWSGVLAIVTTFGVLHRAHTRAAAGRRSDVEHRHDRSRDAA